MAEDGPKSRGRSHSLPLSQRLPTIEASNFDADEEEEVSNGTEDAWRFDDEPYTPDEDNDEVNELAIQLDRIHITTPTRGNQEPQGLEREPQEVGGDDDDDDDDDEEIFVTPVSSPVAHISSSSASREILPLNEEEDIWGPSTSTATPRPMPIQTVCKSTNIGIKMLDTRDGQEESEDLQEEDEIFSSATICSAPSSSGLMTAFEETDLTAMPAVASTSASTLPRPPGRSRRVRSWSVSLPLTKMQQKVTREIGASLRRMSDEFDDVMRERRRHFEFGFLGREVPLTQTACCRILRCNVPPQEELQRCQFRHGMNPSLRIVPAVGGAPVEAPYSGGARGDPNSDQEEAQQE